MPKAVKTFISTKHLRNKTVVITGASSGAGRAAAVEFARHGAKIVLAARNIEALEDVEFLCRQAGSLALAVRADVTDRRQLHELAKIANEFGDGIDVWINNAGVLAAGEFDKTPLEVHQKVIETNLIGYINGAYAVLPYFKEQQHGILINNISVGGWFPVPYGAAYSASKFGLRAFSTALRAELLDFVGIHVCDMYPAFLDTPGIQHAANYTGKAVKPAPPVLDPQEIARVMVDLADRPRKSTSIGAATPLLKLAFLLFPTLSMKITARVMKKYLTHADASETTEGNLFNPAKFGTSIHGGWNMKMDKNLNTEVIVKSAVAAGFAFGLVVTFNKLRNQHRQS